MRLAITFGSQYGPGHERHPVDPRLTRDTYVVFEASDHYTARCAAFAALGSAWAFDYDMDSPDWADMVQYELTEVVLVQPDGEPQ